MENILRYIPDTYVKKATRDTFQVTEGWIKIKNSRSVTQELAASTESNTA